MSMTQLLYNMYILSLKNRKNACSCWFLSGAPSSPKLCPTPPWTPQLLVQFSWPWNKTLSGIWSKTTGMGPKINLLHTCAMNVNDNPVAEMCFCSKRITKRELDPHYTIRVRYILWPQLCLKHVIRIRQTALGSRQEASQQLCLERKPEVPHTTNSHPKTSQYSIYNQFILHTQTSGWITLYNLFCFLEACTDNSSEACAVISCLRLSVCELLHHKSRILHVLGLNRRSLPPQCITKLFLTLWNLGTGRRFTKSIWHTCMILP